MLGMLGLEELEVAIVVIKGNVGWESGRIFFVSASILDARGHGKSINPFLRVFGLPS